MDGDIIKEFKNIFLEKFFFSFGYNEVIISYIVNGEMYYYKIFNFKEKFMLVYLSSNLNGRN